MAKPRPTPLQLLLTGPDLDLVRSNLTPNERRKVLIHAAEKNSGALYDRLTAGLSEMNQSALAIGPGFVGGDTSDMMAFVCDLNVTVTDANIRQVAALFNAWYALVAPDEYHPPTKPESLKEIWELPRL